MGYWIDQAYAGRGIVPRAVAMAIDHCFSTAGLHRVEICIRPENTNSLRVVEKLGTARGRARAPVPAHRRRLARPPDLTRSPLEECPGGMLARLGLTGRGVGRTRHTSHTSDFATHPRRCGPDLGRQLTLGSVDLSALIFVALAVAWAVYLVPKALKHHDDVVRSRSVDRFSHTMRVLARREPVGRPLGRGGSRLVVSPGRAPSPPVVTTKARSAGPGRDCRRHPSGRRPARPPAAAAACSARSWSACSPPSGWPRSA